MGRAIPYSGVVLLATVACFDAPDTSACVTVADCFPDEACNDGHCEPVGDKVGEPSWPFRECTFDQLTYPAACGNGVCDFEYGEAQSNCRQDCSCADGVCDPSELGHCPQCQGACDFDTVCEVGEASATCTDCPTCDDGLCELGELDSCAGDCGGRRAPPLAIFFNAVRAERAEFFLATDAYPFLGGDLSPGAASPGYDVYVGQQANIAFGRANGQDGYRTEVAGQTLCWDKVQLVAGVEDSQGRISVHSIAGAPEEYSGDLGFVRVVDLSDRFSPMSGGIDGPPAGGPRYEFLTNSGWQSLTPGHHRLTLHDADRVETNWEFDVEGGEMVYLVIRDAQGGPMGVQLDVSTVRAGKLGL